MIRITCNMHHLDTAVATIINVHIALAGQTEISCVRRIFVKRITVVTKNY